MTTKEAKTLLADQIISQAERITFRLSETERKMLYFSEISWTLPDMAEVNEELESNYVHGEYEM